MSDDKKITSNLDVAEFSEKDLPPTQKGSDENQDLPHREFKYNLTGEDVREGLKRFQKQYGKTRKIVYTALCGVIIVINLIDMIFNQNLNPLSYLFVGVAIAVLFVVWNNPKMHRNKIAKAVESDDINFTMCIYDEHVFIREQDGGLKIKYDDEKNRFFETKERFIICNGKERIYILPKRCITDNDISFIRSKFEILEERFVKEV